MAKLYANENFPFPVVTRLRELGHDVRTILESGLAGTKLPDDEVLQLATTEGAAVLTFNRRDFFRLHVSSSGHAGIVACKEDTDFPALAERIHTSLRNVPELTGCLVRVNRTVE